MADWRVRRGLGRICLSRAAAAGEPTATGCGTATLDAAAAPVAATTPTPSGPAPRGPARTSLDALDLDIRHVLVLAVVAEPEESFLRGLGHI